MVRLAGFVVLFAVVVVGLAIVVVDRSPPGDGTQPPGGAGAHAVADPSGGPEGRAARARPQGGVLRGAVPEPGTLNPFTTTDSVATRYVLPFTHDTLYDRDPQTGDPRPAAALDHAWSDDRRTLTFRLRDDLRFADGAPVTADDLRFTLDTARHASMAPQSDMSYWLTEAAEASAPDEHTIVVRYAEPAPVVAFAQLATSVRLVERAWFVAAVHALEPTASPGSDAFVTAAAKLGDPGPGTGPYRLVQTLSAARTAGRLELVRNDWSWRRGAQPESWNLDAVRFDLVADDNARFTMLLRGEIDWFSPSGGATVTELLTRNPELAERYAVYSYDAAHIGHYLVYWNCSKPPLDDATVRRALGMLFDRETLLRDVFHGLGSIARGVFKPGMPEYPNDAPVPEFSPEHARELLASKGYSPADGRPLEVEILVAAHPTIRRIVEIAADAFQRAGVSLTALPLDNVSLYGRFQSRDYQGVVLVQQHEAVIDPYESFHSRDNPMGYADPEVDQLLEAARAEPSRERRVELYHRFQALLREDEPVTLLIHPRIELLLHRRFQDAAPGVLGLWHERFWVPADQQLRSS
ncbi:MAG: hypothetical protein IPM29_23725 [Planctomycetes bacterium]|nr:hypothetical protein [Planctomycetota bacterium]